METLISFTMAPPSPGNVNYCTTEQEYHSLIQDAGDRLVVVDCFAEW